MTIRKVELICGTATKPSMIKKLPVYVRKWDDLPDKIKKLYEQDKPWELEGTYGDPSSAAPVQYHRLSIIRDDRTFEIEFFNLAIYMFLQENTEELLRIFRCLTQLENVVSDE
jgi:hypothetical protein